MKVYAFIYCSDTHEGGYITQSLHRSKECAEKAMIFHKEEMRKKWESDYQDYEEMRLWCPFGHSEAWAISEFELLP